MADFIRTVTGDISPLELGYCQCHEHLLLAKGKSYTIDPSLCMDDEEKSTEELISYKAAGGRALVDAQPVGCGRIADGLRRISETSGVRIIASTGFHKLLFFESGNVSYYVEGETYELQPFDLVLVPAGEVHRPIIHGSIPYRRLHHRKTAVCRTHFYSVGGSVTDAALRSGFPSYSAFYRAYLKKYGGPPKDCRHN